MENEMSLQDRLDALYKTYKKTLLWHRIIFLTIAYVVLIAVMVGVSLLFKKNGETNTSAISAISSSIAVLLLFSSSSICQKYSKKLKRLKQEITDLNSLIEPKSEEKSFEEIVNTKNVNAINNIKMPAIKKYLPSKKEKIATYTGLICLLLGIIFMFVLIAIEKYISVPLFIGLLILMFWIYAFGMFLAIGGNWAYSLYYPSVCMVILAGPPCVTALIASNFAEWILILSTCLASALSIFLLCVFLYFNLTKPTKEKKKFIEQNKQIIEQKEEEDVFYWYNQNGDYGTIERLAQFKFIASIYNSNNNKLNEQKFVEYNNALYFIYKSLIDLNK